MSERAWKSLSLQEKAEALRQCGDSLTASQYVEKLSRNGIGGATRNAVVSLIHRVRGRHDVKLSGLKTGAGMRPSRTPTPSYPPMAPMAPMDSKPEQAPDPWLELKKMREPVPLIALLRLPAHKTPKLGEGAGRTLFGEGRESQCKWPMWPHEGRTPHDSMFVCGEEAVFGRPYCAHHCIKAYTTTPQNGDER